MTPEIEIIGIVVLTIISFVLVIAIANLAYKKGYREGIEDGIDAGSWESVLARATRINARASKEWKA